MAQRFLSVLLAAIVAASASAANPTRLPAPDRWLPHAQLGLLEWVTLRVHWYETAAALHGAARERNISPRDLHGFSILSRNVATGEYFCDVFVVRMRGAAVDEEGTVTFGHEALHCFGFSHD